MAVVITDRVNVVGFRPLYFAISFWCDLRDVWQLFTLLVGASLRVRSFVLAHRPSFMTQMTLICLDCACSDLCPSDTRAGYLIFLPVFTE